uniref:Uncharacterized protein n=1 Tax=Ditylenchus dipsaci TaxID=166011 RepID=A0A915DBP2_9BILA
MEEPYHHSYGRIQVPNSYFTPIVFGSLENRKILVWRLPRNIAQSRLAGRKKSSNACTLICLKLAEQIYRNGIIGLGRWRKKSKKHTCSEILVNCMANAILEGNEVHESVLNEQAWRRQNFTIPEAIMATGHLFCELDYCSVRGSIKADLPRYLLGGIQSERLHSLSQLFFY